MRKHEDGITLIALVVTIIVLIILAGVSITNLTGENGIILQTKQAKETARGGDVQDTVSMAAVNNSRKDYNGGKKQTREEVIDQLHKDGKLTDSEVTTLEETDIITIGEITIDFSILDSASNAKTLVQAFKDGDIKEGDYVTDYNSTLDNTNATVSLTPEETGFDKGTQTYKVDTNTTWRVVGLNKDKTQLVITTGSPIKKEMSSSETSQTVNQVYIKKCASSAGTSTDNWKETPYLYLGSAEGWYNTNDELVTNNILDRVCAIYTGKYASETKSMRIEDINVALGLTLDQKANKLYKIINGVKTELISYDSSFYTYEINDYAPENYLKERYLTKYSSLTNKKSGNTVKGTGFGYDYTDSNIVEQSSKLYEVLFKGTESGSNGKSYWIASSGAMETGIIADGVVKYVLCEFGPGNISNNMVMNGCPLFSTNGNSKVLWRGVRPIVYLKAETTVKDLSISSSGKEEDWTTTCEYGLNSIEYGKILE